ncbi:MAG: hypothetical protein CL454_00150 [Acidimicrobiaceae bacterium]|nr:hypothetical protein [Acidimicrobiaceae bacterium]
MPPKVYNIDVRSVDRNVQKFPDASDFTIDLGQEYNGVQSLKLGSLEVPNTRYSVEDTENNMYMSEGIVIGDAVMETALNSLKADGASVVVPATLMPISAFDGTRITTAQAHGLEKFLEWSSQTETRPNAVLVGAEPGPATKRSMRGGIFLHQLSGISFPDAQTVVLPSGAVKSLGVGSGSTGYIHVPPLHLAELLSLLNYLTPATTWSLDKGVVRLSRAVTFEYPMSPPGTQVSLGSILGLTFSRSDRARKPPTLPRVRVPPGFYANPPSLLANAVEEAIMNRGLLTAATFFKITQMDALFSETVTIFQGIYTPELLQDTLQQNMTDTELVLEHVDNDGVPRDGWVRWTLRSTENYPFTLDFSNGASTTIARILGFRQRRYSGKMRYVGEAYAVPATRNVMPAPPPSSVSGTSRGAIRRRVADEFRYNLGIYTITGTAPATQRFTVFTEPGQSFAVPNSGTSRNYFESSKGVGVVDITTKGMSSPQSYSFRRGDVVRLTGVTEETVRVLSVVNTDYRAATIAGQNVFKGVVSVMATDLGGAGYDPNMPPAVNILTPPDSGQAPAITPHIVNGRIVALSLGEPQVPARYRALPIVSVDTPLRWEIAAATAEAVHLPEKRRLRLQLQGPTIAGVVEGRGAVLSGTSGGALDRLFRVVSVSGLEVLVEEDALDATPLPSTAAVGGTLRFSVSDAVLVHSVSKQKRVTLVGALPEATIGHSIVLSQVAYASAVGVVSTITVQNTTATVTHNTLLAAPIAAESRIILRGAGHFNGTWIVGSVTGPSTFTVQVNSGSANFTGTAILGAMNCSTCGTTASVAVGTPQQKPTISFDAVSVPHPNYWGVGGLAAFAPAPVGVSATVNMASEMIVGASLCIEGFLQNAFSTSNTNAVGAPVLSFSGGETTSDVFNTRTSAIASSNVISGNIVSPFAETDAARVVFDDPGTGYTILAGKFVGTDLSVRLTLDRAVQTSMVSQSLTVSNFYYDGEYLAKTLSERTEEGWAPDWELLPLDGTELVSGRAEILVRTAAASLSVPMGSSLHPINPTTASILYPSTFTVSWGGQYTNMDTVGASLGVSNDVTTRIGIVTYARFENNAFRYLIEYNHRGLNANRGFEDTVANGTIVLTFSHVAEPRTEFFGASSSDMARLENEMRGKVSPFTEQIILRRLGFTLDVHGLSQHLANSQWMLDGQPYRILQFLDAEGNKLGETSHVHTMGPNRQSDIFGKLIIPSAYNTVRFQAYELGLTRPRTLRFIRIRLLGYDEMPYPLHGRELTFSLLLTCNMNRE